MAVLLRSLPLIVAAVLLVAALVDIVRIDPDRVRALPKSVWAVVSLVVVVGPILWFALGRQPLATRGLRRYRTAPVAPDDDPEFLRRIAKEKEQEQRIRELEQQLGELDGDDDAQKNPQ
ncbi:MAG: PLDc N-terminal domain-containing protein [Protaetiibacter sp.]